MKMRVLLTLAALAISFTQASPNKQIRPIYN